MALWHQIRRSGIHRLVARAQSPSFLAALVRSLAVPAHVKAKLEAEPSGPRINGAITATSVRLVTGEGHYIVSIREALDRAKQLNLDLVEVQRTANPPVCKLMDFHKEKYKQEEKEKERTKSKSTDTLRNGENKEVRFTAKTEPKDLKMKAEMIARLMERGYRVKCTALPASGNEEDNLGQLLPRIISLIDDIAILESGPHVVGNKQAYVIVRHAKFTTKKMGKKAIKALDAVTKAQSSVQAQESEPSDSEKTNTEVISDSEDDRGTPQVSGFDAEWKPSHNINSGQPLYQNFSSSKPLMDSARPKQDLSRDQININPAAGISKSEPPVVEGNRYAKQAPRTVSDARVQFNPNQRPFNNSSNQVQFNPNQRPFNNSSNHNSPRFDSARPVDQNRMGRVSASDPSTSAGSAKIVKPIFISTKLSGSAEQSSKSNSAAEPGHTESSSSPNRSYGIFSGKKPVGSESSKETRHEKTGTGTRSYGIFSNSQAGASGA